MKTLRKFLRVKKYPNTMMGAAGVGQGSGQTSGLPEEIALLDEDVIKPIRKYLYKWILDPDLKRAMKDVWDIPDEEPYKSSKKPEPKKDLNEMLTEMTHLGTLASAIGSKTAEYHRQKYLNKDVLKTHTFILNQAHEDLPKGSVVHGSKLVTHEGRYHLLVHHKGHQHFIPTHKLHKPLIGGRVGTWHEQVEDSAIHHINRKIKKELHRTGRRDLPIRIGHKTYLVAGAKKITKFAEGKPKADFVFHDSTGRAVFFASHKEGPHANDFQQYGGVSDLAKHNHPVVAEFTRRMLRKTTRKKGMAKHPGKRWLMKLHSHNKHHVYAMRHAMFGSQSVIPRSAYGAENVHAIIHGEMGLTPHKHGYHLIAAKITHNDKSFNPREHRVDVLARRTEARNDLGFHQTRVMIIPHNEKRKGEYI